jgi:TRAP-type C4-dicarboxylate transport system substrate-binding protein
MSTRTKLVALLGAALIGTGAATTHAVAATTLTMSSWVPPTHFVMTEILEPWAAEVAKVTEGRVAVRILPKPVGAPAQHWELARRGVADVTWGNFTYEPERFKSIWFAEMPFSGSRSEASSVALWETYQQYLSGHPAYAGVVMLGVGMLGGGALHHTSKPLVEADDLRNQKVRMGGPIQKRLLEEFGAVPIAAPGPRAYELLEGRVVDASLHSLESVIGFRLEDQLKHHTKIPDGLYDATFFIVINERKWNGLSAADRDAIMRVSGAALSRRWGERFDAHNAAAEAALRERGNAFATPSAALLERIRAVREQMLAEWAADTAGVGVADPMAMVRFYEQRYQALAGK